MQFARAGRGDHRAKRMLQERPEILSQAVKVQRQIFFERRARKGDDTREFSAKFIRLHEEMSNEWGLGYQASWTGRADLPVRPILTADERNDVSGMSGCPPANVAAIARTVDSRAMFCREGGKKGKMKRGTKERSGSQIQNCTTLTSATTRTTLAKWD